MIKSEGGQKGKITYISQDKGVGSVLHLIMVKITEDDATSGW